jgi:hypothetical protein
MWTCTPPVSSEALSFFCILSFWFSSVCCMFAQALWRRPETGPPPASSDAFFGGPVCVLAREAVAQVLRPAVWAMSYRLPAVHARLHACSTGAQHLLQMYAEDTMSQSVACSAPCAERGLS